MERKKCNKCNQIKPTDDFFKSKRNKDGCRSHCKICEKKANSERESKYSELRKKYRQGENYKEIKKKYYLDNKDKILQENSAWRQTFKGRLSSYKKAASKRNIEWLLNEDEFKSFWGKPCYYCNDEISTIGIDRIDNNQGYMFSNCRPCCSTCNTMKMALSDELFIKKIKQIINNLNKK